MDTHHTGYELRYDQVTVNEMPSTHTESGILPPLFTIEAQAHAMAWQLTPLHLDSGKVRLPFIGAASHGKTTACSPSPGIPGGALPTQATQAEVRDFTSHAPGVDSHRAIYVLSMEIETGVLDTSQDSVQTSETQAVITQETGNWKFL